MTIKKSPELNALIESYFENEPITNTTSTTVYQDKILLIFVPLFTGFYNLKFYCETAISLVAQRVFVTVVEGANIYAEVCPPVKETYNNRQWLPISGFKRVYLTKDISYIFKLQFKVSGGTGYIRRARLLLRRMF